jgi:hypothetical protein
MTQDYAVKRGRCRTLFATAYAAYTYWTATLGGVLQFRAQGDNRWYRLIL